MIPAHNCGMLLTRIVGMYVLLGFPSTAIPALSLTLITSPEFGILYGGASGRQFILNTNSTITGTHSSDYISGAAAGQLTVGDTASPGSISILVDNISSFGGLSVNDALCSYNGGIQQSCDGAGMTVTSVSSATLRIGLEISTAALHSGGDSASISMDVSVTII